MTKVRQYECPNKEFHTKGPNEYIEWQKWASEMMKTHKQEMCKVCRFWAIWTPKELVKHPCDIGEDKLDHDIEWVDDSFDHEFGTEVCGHWECKRCGEEVNN